MRVAVVFPFIILNLSLRVGRRDSDLVPETESKPSVGAESEISILRFCVQQTTGGWST